MANQRSSLESTFCQLIQELRATLEVSIDMYNGYKRTGRLPDIGSSNSINGDRSSSSSSVVRLETIKAPSPPRYPPPHAQNSPTFFPLSCVRAPQIEPEELKFALEEALADATTIDEAVAAAVAEEQILGTFQGNMCTDAAVVHPTNHCVILEVEHEPEPNPNEDGIDQDYDSDSSDEFSWARWYVTRNYAAEREEEDRRDAEDRAAGRPVFSWEDADEVFSGTGSDSGYEPDDDDFDDPWDELAWMYDGGEMIAAY